MIFRAINPPLRPWNNTVHRTRKGGEWGCIKCKVYTWNHIQVYRLSSFDSSLEVPKCMIFDFGVKINYFFIFRGSFMGAKFLTRMLSLFWGVTFDTIKIMNPDRSQNENFTLGHLSILNFSSNWSQFKRKFRWLRWSSCKKYCRYKSRFHVFFIWKKLEVNKITYLVAQNNYIYCRDCILPITYLVCDDSVLYVTKEGVILSFPASDLRYFVNICSLSHIF